MLTRTKYPYGRSFPYGSIVRLMNNRIYKNRRFIFCTITNGKALLFREGKTERSQYYLLVNPNKLKKIKIVSNDKKNQSVNI